VNKILPVDFNFVSLIFNSTLSFETPESFLTEELLNVKSDGTGGMIE